MEILTLWPLSQGEIEGHREGFLDSMRRGRLPDDPPPVGMDEMAERVVRGGLPAVHDWPERRRAAWLRSYVMAVLDRDVRELASIEALAMLPRLVTLLATRVGTLVNLADIARTLGVPHSTLQRHMALLVRTYLIRPVPGWGTRLGARVLKSGKLLFADTGLATALLRLTAARLPAETVCGPMLENFVIMELAKQVSWHEEQPELYHFRTPKGHEAVPYRIRCGVRRSAIRSMRARRDHHHQAPSHPSGRSLQGSRPRPRGEGRGGAPARREGDRVGPEGAGIRLVLGRFPSPLRQGEIASVDRHPSEHRPGMGQWPSALTPRWFSAC
jgi:predicted AAA+ superfamily ATPase